MEAFGDQQLFICLHLLLLVMLLPPQSGVTNKAAGVRVGTWGVTTKDTTVRFAIPKALNVTVGGLAHFLSHRLAYSFLQDWTLAPMVVPGDGGLLTL